MKISSLLQILVLYIGLIGCSNTYYIPHSNHVPLFTEEGQISASGKASAGFYHTGADLQFAKALTNKKAYMLNTGFNLLGEGGGSVQVKGGIGTYRPINRFLVFETYGGLSYGTVKNYHDQPYEEVYDSTGFVTIVPNPILRAHSRVHYGGAWVQPQLGFTTRFFDLALISGFHYLNFFSVRQSAPLHIPEQQELFQLRSNKGNLFWEPGIMIRLGWDSVKAELQYTGSAVINNQSLDYEPFRVSLGLTMKIPSRIKGN